MEEHPATLRERLVKAVNERRVTAFRYDDLPRVVEPHTVGMDPDGEVVMIAYQRGGESETGSVPGWQTFRIKGITDLHFTGEVFPRARPDYNPNDPGIVEVFIGVEADPGTQVSG